MVLSGVFWQAPTVGSSAAFRADQSPASRGRSAAESRCTATSDLGLRRGLGASEPTLWRSWGGGSEEGAAEDAGDEVASGVTDFDGMAAAIERVGEAAG